METPLYTRLTDYHSQNRISFAMPGHKNGVGLFSELLSCDVTELNKTEDLFHPNEYVKKSLELLRDIYKSDKSFILTSGSTTAIHTMICATLRKGDTLLVASDCHMSVVNICAIVGIKMRFLNKEYKNGLPTKTVGIEGMLEKHPDIKACLITSPNYYGVCSDINLIANECHKHNIPLLVDEAHGAHFVASDRLPKTAIELGADISCQSAHKTLNALTGAAYLHIKSNLVSPKRIENTLLMLHSSSPAYPIAASADVARAMLNSGWDNIIDVCEEFKKSIRNLTKLEFLENDDITRLVVCFDNYKTSGYDVEKQLCEKYKIDIEMATANAIVLIVTPSNTNADMEALGEALIQITSSTPPKKKTENFSYVEHKDIISPSIAYWSKTEETDIDRSEGRVCAHTVTIYPPGIPVLYAGEVITYEAIAYINEAKAKGAKITGMSDNKVTVCERTI